MARKKSVSNQSARREEIVDYDVKRLRQMSAEELQDYYDRVEPLSDDEVNAIYDRVMPKIAYEIASNNQQKKPRHIGSSIKKTVLVAICMTLMLSVVAQALGIPVWETFITWTKDNFRLYVSYTSPLNNDPVHRELSKEEALTWGEELNDALIDIGVAPYLPCSMPQGYQLTDLFYSVGDNGYSYVNALYENDNNRYINLILDICATDNYAHEMAVEYDDTPVLEIIIDGITYRIASNLSENIVVWNDSLGSYSIAGNIETNILEDMIRTIHRSN